RLVGDLLPPRWTDVREAHLVLIGLARKLGKRLLDLRQDRGILDVWRADEEVRCALTGGTRRLRCTGRVRLDLRAHVAEVELPQRVLRVVYRRRTRDGRERAPGTDRNGERGATLEVDAQIQSAAEQTAEAGEEHDAGDGRPHAESAD